MIVFDMLGNRGLGNLLVYVVPGLALELIMLLFPRYVSTWFSALVAGGIANATGSLIVSWVFLRLPFIPLASSFLVSFFFGGIGGVLGYKLYAVVAGFRPGAPSRE